jgi:hypothetical protein
MVFEFQKYEKITTTEFFFEMSRIIDLQLEGLFNLPAAGGVNSF